MKKIISTQNPEIKAVAKLNDPKERIAQGCFIAEGTRVISTLIAGGIKPITLYITEQLLEKVPKTIATENITLVSDHVMKKISQATTPSGILAVFPIPTAPALKKLGPGIVLANMTDPGNMGTLIRTAAAMNVSSIVIIDGVDPWNSKVVQATAGTIAYTNLFRLSWDQLIKNKGALKLYALVTTGGKKIETVDCHNGLLVVGSEAHGIPENWLSDCDEKITLPMPGKIESLNAAVAGSIATYLVFGKK